MMHPFEVDFLNSNILKYSFPGEYLFFAPVCRSWHEAWGESDRDTLTDVRQGVSLSQIKECSKTGSETVTVDMLKTVASTGDLDLLKSMFLQCEDKPTDGTILTAAASSGNLEMVKWLFFDIGCSTAFDPLDEACNRGDIPMYQWLRSHDAKRSWTTVSKAAFMGHLDIMKVMHSDQDEEGTGFTIGEYDEAVSAATRNRQFHVLDWLYEVGVVI